MSLLCYNIVSVIPFFSDSHVVSDMVLSLLGPGIEIDSSIELAQFKIGRIDVENITKSYPSGKNIFMTMNTYIQICMQRFTQ